MYLRSFVALTSRPVTHVPLIPHGFTSQMSYVSSQKFPVYSINLQLTHSHYLNSTFYLSFIGDTSWTSLLLDNTQLNGLEASLFDQHGEHICFLRYTSAAVLEIQFAIFIIQYAHLITFYSLKPLTLLNIFVESIHKYDTVVERKTTWTRNNLERVVVAKCVLKILPQTLTTLTAAAVAQLHWYTDWHCTRPSWVVAAETARSHRNVMSVTACRVHLSYCIVFGSRRHVIVRLSCHHLSDIVGWHCCMPAWQ